MIEFKGLKITTSVELKLSLITLGYPSASILFCNCCLATETNYI